MSRNDYRFIFLITILNLFKGSLLFKLRNLLFLIYILYFIINLPFLIKNKKIEKRYKVFYIYMSFFILFFINSWGRNGLIFAIFSLVIYLINICFWMLIFKKNKFLDIKYIINLNIKLGIIIVFFGIYQYFVDPTIFGLVRHSVYGNAEIMNSGRALRRVTSLIGSPQNYSLYIGLLTIVTYLLSYKKLTFCFVFGGLLSGGRSYSLFLIFLLVHYFIVSKSKKKIYMLVSIIGLMPILLNHLLNNRTLSRAFVFFNDWPALKIFLKMIKDTDNILLGEGLGVGNRVIAGITKIPRSYVSESYLVNFYVQNGLLGVSLFLVVIIVIFIKIYFLKKDYVILFIPVFINICFTPSFEGIAMSYYIWLIFFTVCYFSKNLLAIENIKKMR